jgi:hypothetical protein
VSDPIGWHIGLRLADDRVIAGTAEERRILARIVSRHGSRAALAAWRAADTHLHAQLFCDRGGVGGFTQRVASAARIELALPVPMRMTFIKPLKDQWHAQHTHGYILTQEEHHGLRSDPFHEASNLPDLLGMRMIGGDAMAVVKRYLPRVRLEELAALLGHDVTGGAVQLPLLADAAAAAFALPDLAGRTDAEALDVGVRTVVRLRGQACDPAPIGAVRRQWRLRSAAARAPGPTEVPDGPPRCGVVSCHNPRR